MLEVLLFFIFFTLSISNGVFISNFFDKRLNYQLIPTYTIAGIVCTTLFIYFTRLIGLPFLVTALVSFFLFFWQRKKLLIFPKIKITNLLAVSIFCLIITILMGGISFYQGYKNDNLVFFNENAHDGLWHIALQRSLFNSVPPENPIYSGGILKEYHYFADLYWAYLSSVSGLRPEIIYTIFLPIFLPFIFALSTFSFFSSQIKDKVLIYLMGSILVLGSGFSFFVPFLFPGGSNNQSSFWLDQPVGYIINPHLLLSFSLINVLFFMLWTGLKKWRILIGIVLASLIVIKVYAFLIFFPVLVVAAAILYIKKREIDLLISCIVAVLLSGCLILTSKVGGGFPFIFEPGWFIKSMFESSDHLNASWWELQRQIFAQDNNYLRLIAHWFYGFWVFVVGNFGLKVLGLIMIPLLLLSRLKFASQDKLIILFSIGIIIISFAIPILFIQKGVVWSSIQFLHFAQLPLCLLLFLSVRNFKRNMQTAILVVVLLLGLPTTLSAFVKTIEASNYILYPSEIVSGLKTLESINTKETIYTTDFTDTSIVPAISGKPVYFADPNMLGILQINFDQRKNYLSMIATTSACPNNSLLVTNPASTASGKVLFKNTALKIVECKKER